MSNVSRRLNDASQFATQWIGSVPSLVVHTILFIASFCLVFAGFSFEQILLVVTTIVSLEAIYLAIFIQMAINQHAQSLDAAVEDIDEIHEKVEEIHEDVEEIEKDVDEIQGDIDEIQKDETADVVRETQNKVVLDKIESNLVDLVAQIHKMKEEMR